jgi:hypothetical protein
MNLTLRHPAGTFEDTFGENKGADAWFIQDNENEVETPPPIKVIYTSNVLIT